MGNTAAHCQKIISYLGVRQAKYLPAGLFLLLMVWDGF